MGDYYCTFCDKSIKLIQKKKHLNTKSHTVLSLSIINRFCVKNPEIFKIDFFGKHLDNYNKKFMLYLVRCE